MSYGKPTVYLAGPITGETFAGCTSWRDYARTVLAQHGILGISPLRWKKSALPEDEPINNHGYTMPLATDKGIITRDRFDCTRADVVLVNLVGAERISVGTVMEIAWADLARRPVVLAMEEGNAHRHAMLNEAAGFICSSLQQAVETVVSILDVANVEEHS